MSHIPYDKNLNSLARQLRKNSTLGEVILWKHLSGRKCCGLQFNRQKPLGKYIVDFYCKSMNLVIEIDGYSHGFKEAYQKDISKQADLELMGLTVLRFNEGDVRNKIDSILQIIEAFIQTNNPPNPLFKGEENLPHHVYLCGFMGSGKTTVGSLLAKKLNYGFLDTDQMIEEKENKTIREIFETSGEPRFREIENKILKSVVATKKKLVVALGGGSLIRKQNLTLVRKDGILIYLKTDLKTIRTRIASDPARPLLKKTSLETLFNARKPGYEKADLIFDTPSQTPAETAETLFLHLLRSNKK
jgi:shikimate kinase